MSIAITKYKVVARDKNGNLVCSGVTTDEDVVDSVGEKLRENGYDVRLYDIIPVIGFGGH
jgi:hypothetical protein